jgi:hypothetical protein
LKISSFGIEQYRFSIMFTYFKYYMYIYYSRFLILGRFQVENQKRSKYSFQNLLFSRFSDQMHATFYFFMIMIIKKTEINFIHYINKGLCRAMHEKTAVCWQGKVEQVHIKKQVWTLYFAWHSNMLGSLYSGHLSRFTISNVKCTSKYVKFRNLIRALIRPLFEIK